MNLDHLTCKIQYAIRSKIGSTKNQDHNAEGQREGAGRPKKPWLGSPEPVSPPTGSRSFSKVTEIHYTKKLIF